MQIDLKPGTIYDKRYEILKALGVGGMGVVYLARDRELKARVAIKLLNIGHLSDKEDIDRFLREFKQLSGLSQTNLAQFYSASIDKDGIPYTVAEYLEGKTLRQIIDEKRKLPWQRVARIASQVCDAMAFAHEKGIIHRDLKPTNIMLIDKPKVDTVKVIDFGMARVAAVIPGFQNLTKTGQLIVCSTPYMSPEAAIGEKLDNSSDIYSLACVIYECLSGEKLFEAENPIGILRKHSKEDPASVLETTLENKEIVALLKSALSKDRQKRPKNMAEFKAQINAIKDNRGQTGEHLAAGSGGRKAEQATRFLVWSGLAALAALTFSFAAFVDREKEGDEIFECNGTVYYLDLGNVKSPSYRRSNNYRIKEVELLTDSGLIKLKGDLPAKAIYDLQHGKIWKALYTRIDGKNILENYWSMGQNENIWKCMKVINSSFSGGNSADYVSRHYSKELIKELRLENKDAAKKLKEIHHISFDEKIQDNDRILRMPTGETSVVPQAMKVVSAGADKIRIFVNTNYLNKQHEGIVAFTLINDEGQWKIDKINGGIGMQEWQKN